MKCHVFLWFTVYIYEQLLNMSVGLSLGLC